MLAVSIYPSLPPSRWGHWTPGFLFPMYPALLRDCDEGEQCKFQAKPSRVFRVDDSPRAHRVMEANDANGKMVFTL